MMAPIVGDRSHGSTAPAGEWLKTLTLAAYLLAHANGLFLRQRATRSEAPTPSGVGQTLGLLLGFLVALRLDRRGILAYALGPGNGDSPGTTSMTTPEAHNQMDVGGALPARHLCKRLAAEWGKGTLWGLALAIIPIFFFLRPFVLARPVEHPTYTNLTLWTWLRLVLVEIPFLTALPEEAAWRGALEPRLVAHLGPWRGVLWSNAAFGLAHFAVTRANTGIVGRGALLPRWLLILGGMAATGVGGAVFSLVRARTGSLVGAIAAHWAVNATMSTALYLRGRRSRRSGPPLSTGGEGAG